MNKAIIYGTLGADPEMRVLTTGNSKCELRLATNRKYKHGEQLKEETTWHNVTVWGSQGENCAKFLHKGDKVLVEGRIQTDSYEKDGVKQYRTFIVAEHVSFPGRPKGEAAPYGTSGAGNSAKHTSGDEDDGSGLPF